MTSEEGFDAFFYSASDGLRLHARVYGAGHGGLPVVCLPGLTRNARDFHELALFLSRDAPTPRRVVAFDYRGRGDAERDRNWRTYDVAVEAGDIMAGITALGIAHAAFVGTSRGGLVIFALAAMRPAALKAVVLNDVGPVVEGEGLARIRGYLGRAPRPKTLEEAIAIQRAALGEAFPALSEEDWARMTAALYRRHNGRLVADFDPRLAKTLDGIDLNAPLPELWPQFLGLARVPVLAFRGENSRLLSAGTLEEMARRHPSIEAVTVAGQGHAPLLETGDLPRRIAGFVDRTGRQRRAR